jgi:hypothetical protein
VPTRASRQLVETMPYRQRPRNDCLQLNIEDRRSSAVCFPQSSTGPNRVFDGDVPEARLVNISISFISLVLIGLPICVPATHSPGVDGEWCLLSVEKTQGLMDFGGGENAIVFLYPKCWQSQPGPLYWPYPPKRKPGSWLPAVFLAKACCAFGLTV